MQTVPVAQTIGVATPLVVIPFGPLQYAAMVGPQMFDWASESEKRVRRVVFVLMVCIFGLDDEMFMVSARSAY